MVLRLTRLAQAIESLGTAVPGGDQLFAFFDTPHELLRRHRPAELLKSDYGFGDLIDLIEAGRRSCSVGDPDVSGRVTPP